MGEREGQGQERVEEVLGWDGLDNVYAPLMAAQEVDIVHLPLDLATEVAHMQQELNIWDGMDPCFFNTLLLLCYIIQYLNR